MAQIGFRFLAWNIKFFGQYNYDTTMGQIAQTIIDQDVDVVVILEVKSSNAKSSKINAELVQECAKTAVKELWDELKKKDLASGWEKEISKSNAGSAKRDAYAFFWRSTPQSKGGVPSGVVRATSISKSAGPVILMKDASGNKLKFSDNRRPGACIFEFSANGNSSKAVLVGFHAPEEKEKQRENKIKKAILDCQTATEAYAKENDNIPAVIGGDLNLDYATYEPWFETLIFNPAITSEGASSVLKTINFDQPGYKVAGNAFDNFLVKDLHLFGDNAKVVDVIKEMSDLEARKDKKAKEADDGYKKRKRSELDKQSWGIYYPLGGTSSISDHFPIVGSFSF